MEISEDLWRRYNAITPREAEVAALLLRGFTNRRIGDVLKIAENTVKAHVEALMDTLGCDSRLAAGIYLWHIKRYQAQNLERGSDQCTRMRMRK